jgi:hypothetical protein
MKRFVLFLLVLGVGVSLFAQMPLQMEHHFATGSGGWRFIGDRLHQTEVDSNARLAKVNIRVPQSGAMLYEFNVRYEDVANKSHWGFGIHIFANDVIHRASWGSGRSYLIWLNYDLNPVTPGIPRGLSAQVYRSVSNTRMDLVESFDLNEFAYLLTAENLSYEVPVALVVNGNTGEVRLYDPTDPYYEWYFYFFLPRESLPLRGDWVSLRSNGLRLSFGLEN